MSHVAILIALFTAAQHPTHKNCSALIDGLATVSASDALDPGKSLVHWDNDMKLIIQFAKTQCKDGVKRK